MQFKQNLIFHVMSRIIQFKKNPTLNASNMPVNTNITSMPRSRNWPLFFL
jgi:hypothetical protein